ncbi:hypothetical protein EDD16DRAFT_113667 [Pisolithus croceorrhizus]|nr:hypothetical protein EDD16DRAFT_113667 [Pisolithus croceorrhizus]KAI6167489.1 hypothetical protein EDD17DRAFT_1043477 [Pisolithus thermaeus]
MSSERHQTNTEPSGGSPTTVDAVLEHARRAFALKKYEQAVELYATALEVQTKTHDEDAPEMADLYFSYGKALLENAISQASVLGKEPEPGAAEDETPQSNGKGPFLSFSGDGDEEDGALDLLAQSGKEEEQSDEEGDEGEPEDDFNAAWDVFELARSIYDKGKDHGDEIKLKLADTYIALGDVSLETEKFDQAITDYSAGLALKTELLPISSRQIAEAHYKLSIVLDLTSGRLSDAIAHVEKALNSVSTRISEVRDGLDGKLVPLPTAQSKEQDRKGKGRADSIVLVPGELVQNMTRSQMESELRELESLRGDLAAKVEELKTAPSEPTDSAPALVAKALDDELNVRSITVPGQPPIVHDLTSMVKKKKKPVDTEGTPKRKADDDNKDIPLKKAKLGDEAS